MSRIFSYIFDDFSHTIYIGRHVYSVFIDVLGCRISGGCTYRIGVGVGKTKTKVYQFYIIVYLRNHDVLRFQVAMHHMIFVQAFKST